MSSLTSRSCRTHDLRSSSRLGCTSFASSGEMAGTGLVFGIGMGKAPLQYFQVSFDARANWRLRRQREYSGPVESSFRMWTPGRRGEVCNCISPWAPDLTMRAWAYF
jgi:hypothetical protein